MKKLIYTTDFSQGSIAALKYAVSLGRILGYDVIALHVFPPTGSKNKTGQNKAVKEQQKKLRDFCKDNLKEDYDPSELSVAALMGNDVALTISNFIRDMNVHMVIMGACGKGTIKEIFMGSTTKDLIQACPFPILAVPGNFQSGKVEKVIFASLLDKEDVEHLVELIQLMNTVEPEIEVVHVTHKEAKAAEKALSGFKKLVAEKVDYKKISYRSIFSNHVFETLKKTIEDVHPDVIVMPERKETNEMGRLIIRNRTKWMQSCTKVPVLSFPPAV